MTSKNLFFKLQMEDLKRRIWIVALSVLVFFLFLTVVVAISLGNFDNNDYYTKERITMELSRLIGPQYIFLCLITICGAVLCGLSSFFYLQSRKKVDLYHSIPVRRELLFAVSNLNSLLIYIIPYLINVVLCFLILRINGYMEMELFTAALSAVGINLLFYCLIYTLTVIAVMLTGNIIISCLGTAVFLSYGPAFMLIKEIYFQEFFKTYAGTRPDSALYNFLSPIGSYLTIVNAKAYGGLQVSFPEILKIILVTVILLLFALFLYKKRPSEAAGKAMAFSVSQPVIKFLLVIPAALGGGIIFRQMSADHSNGWFWFGLVFALLVSYGMIEIIYNFDIRSVFAHKSHLLASGAVLAVIVCAFQFDVFRYDQYIPEQNKIKTMSVSISGLDKRLDYLEKQEEDNRFEYIGDRDAYQLKYMKLTDFKAAYELAGAGIEKAGRNDNGNEKYFYYKVKYSLSNGRKVYRNYCLTSDDNYNMLKELFANKEFKQGHYPVYRWNAEDLAGVSCYGLLKDKEFSLNKAELQELLELYKAELAELTLDDIRDGQPEATLVFWLRDERNPRYKSSQTADYYVYPKFQKTIAFLKKHGFDASGRLRVQDVKSLSIINYNTLADQRVDVKESSAALAETNPSVTYTDKDKIEEILPLLMDSSYCQNYSSIIKWKDNLEVNLVLSRDDYGNVETYTYYFRDKVPDYVKEDVLYSEE